MKTTTKRGFVVFVLIAAVVFGLGLLGWRFYENGEKWATMNVNAHLTTKGSFIAAGNVLDRNGEMLASTKDSKRVYNDSENVRRSVLHIVGDSEGFIKYGVQSAYRTQLSGYDKVSGIYTVKRYGRGNDVKLTVDSKLCAAAYEALGSKKGVIGVYNYKTGELLCSVSNPNYDVYDKPDKDEIDSDERYEGLYINRLLDGLYTPGSTFKIITTASALENIPDIDDFSYTCKGKEVINGVNVTCHAAHGTVDLGKAFTKSCNCAYAVLAEKIGAEKLSQTAIEFGFGKTFDFGNTVTKASRFDLSGAAVSDVAWAGVGQYTTLVNPYHMLTVLGSIANGGEAVLPYVVSEVDSPSGKTVERTQAQSVPYISSELAAQLKELMRDNVRNGYGDYRFGDIDFCGKTGTAEVSEKDAPHAWFAGFSYDEEYPVAIVVVVENSGWASDYALPIASKVIKNIPELFE